MDDTAESADSLKRLVEQARQLYSLPAVAVRVLELTRHPKVDVRALKECIENDPALTSKILRTVNSSLFGLSTRVSDLNQALALLGTKPLKMLVLGFSLPKELFAGLEAKVLQQYWHHTLVRAVAARELSQRFWKRPGDEAFIAGLLQGVGMLVLIQQVGDAYVAFLNQVVTHGGDLRKLEAETLGFDHVSLSAHLLEQWQLPEAIVQAIRSSQDETEFVAQQRDEQSVPQILQLAEMIAVLLTRQRADVLPRLTESAEKVRGISADQIQQLVDELQTMVGDFADVLSLELPDNRSYSDVLLEALSRLAALSEQSAGEMLRSEELEATMRQQGERLRRAVCDPRRDTVTLKDVKDNSLADTVTYAPPQAQRMSCAKRVEIAQSSVGPVRSVACGHDPGLVGRVEVAVAACRKRRCPLSVGLIEIDRFDELILNRTTDGAARCVQALGTTISQMCQPSDQCIQVDDARYALIRPNCDRDHAVDAARQLIQKTHSGPEARSLAAGGFTISVGLATLSLPPKNFPVTEIIAAAGRCLYAASSSGGDTLKSIDI